MATTLPVASTPSAASHAASTVMATPRPATATPLPQGATSSTPLTSHITPPATSTTSTQTNGTVRSSIPQPRFTFDDVRDGSPGIGSDDGVALSSAEIDGRMTPLASESSRLSQSESSGPSDPAPVSPQSSAPTTSSRLPTQNTNNMLYAEVGASSLGTEIQLRDALTGKDRMFLLLVSRELEAFIARVVNGEQGGITIPPGHSASVALATLGPAMILTTTTTSKYQRMLVYKVAEWYGIRGIGTQDGPIYIGVQGALHEKSPSLRLADIVLKPPTPKQTFKLMQRVPLGSAGSASSRAASVAGDDASDAGGSKRKTLEEREAEYALARERIYGRDGQSAEGSTEAIVDVDETRTKSTRQEVDDDDFVPRSAIALQPVYPSLYRPKAETPGPPPQIPVQPNYQPDPSFAYQPAPISYGFPYGNNGYPQQPSNGYHQQPNYPPAQPYMDGSAPPFIPHNAYGGNQWQPGSANRGQMPVQQQHQQQQWYNMPLQTNQPMPMIPQGVQAYPPQYPQQYPQQPPQMYAPLVQPTPMRPGPQPHPHSSNSSSISSRSYQDYSRPHSRGSTTSTRSAASSVRLGAMYPANHAGHAGPGPGYRQRGMKGQGVNGMTTYSLNQTRTTREHSPSSVTTSSSRSSRRASSISVQQPAPSQHQLPQRPDWAANNVPYHPAPMLPMGSMHPTTNVAEFPPLLRNGTNAEPMQVERAKMRPPNMNVWNGAVSRVAQTRPMQVPRSPVNFETPSSPYSVKSLQRETDPDFPRRAPIGRPTGTLFDPSSSSPKPSSASAVSVPDSSMTAASVGEGEMSVEDAIEAKLAALSVSSGIDIGPPPIKAPSYAKIVRRD